MKPARGLPLPEGLVARTVEVDDEPYLVLSHGRATNARVDIEGLTKAEREVAGLLVAGKSHAEIAHARGSALRTVANQVASIYRKAKVSSRVELALRLR